LEIFMKNFKITNLSDKDIEGINQLYNYYINETAFTFDIKEKIMKKKKNGQKPLMMKGLINA